MRPPSWPYEVDEKLAQGGMGVVYRARDTRTGEWVALKVLHGASAARCRRFGLEAEALRRLESPHVVAVRGSGLTPRGEPYLAMSYVEGGSLQDRLDRGGPLPEAEVRSIARRIALALRDAHALGLLHRDVKPANVLLRERDGAALLTDFGLVKEAEGEGLTKTGQILGSPGYLAPEQLGHSREHSETTDVFGLGATIYAALNGEPPFQGPTLLEAFQATLTQPPRPFSVPTSPDLVALCLRCLAKDPAQRYPNARALLEALDALPEDDAAPSPRSTPALVALLALGASLGVVGLVMGSRELTRAPKSPTPPAVARPSNTSGPAPSAATPPLEAVDLEALLDQAFDLAAAGDAKAEALVERCYQLDPESSRVNMLRGLILQRKGALNEARRCFDRAIELDPNQADALNLRAMIHRAQGRIDAARSDLQRSLLADPKLSWAWGNLASLRSDEGDWAGALRALDRAVQLQPDPRHFASRAMAHLGLGDHERALADAERAVKTGPQFATGWVTRATLKRIKGDLSSLADYDRALRIDPNNLQGRLGRANDRLTQHDYRGCVEDVGLVLARVDPRRSEQARFSLLDRAVAFAFLGELEAAAGDVELALEIAPNDADAARWMAEIRWRQGLVRKSLRDFERLLRRPTPKPGRNDAIARLPTPAFLQRRLGLLRLQLNERDEAVRLIRSAAALGDASAGLWLAALTGDHDALPEVEEAWPRPLVDYLRGRLPASSLLEAARADSPGALCLAHVLLGVQAEGRGEADAARAQFRKAVETGRHERESFVWAKLRLRSR